MLNGVQKYIDAWKKQGALAWKCVKQDVGVI